MKNYKLLLLPLVASFLVGCTSQRNNYVVREESPIYEQVLRSYAYEDNKLPMELKKAFKMRNIMGIEETFSEFLESIDQADGMNDNHISRRGIITFLNNNRARDTFNELDEDVEKLLNPKFKE